MTETLLLLLGAISTFANRVSEAIKAALKSRYPDMPHATISMIALLTSLVAGIVGALLLNVNLLTLLPPSPYTANLPALFGVILTGCIASFGSEGLHWLLDLLHARRDEMATPTAKATVEVESGGAGSPSASASVSASASSDSSAPADPATLPRSLHG